MTTFPYGDLPGAGALDECELNAACWRKRSIVLTTAQMRAVDETAGLCGVCGGECPVPAACQLAERHGKQRWVIAVVAIALGAVIAAVCWVGYMQVPT